MASTMVGVHIMLRSPRIDGIFPGLAWFCAYFGALCVSVAVAELYIDLILILPSIISPAIVGSDD